MQHLMPIAVIVGALLVAGCNDSAEPPSSASPSAPVVDSSRTQVLTPTAESSPKPEPTEAPSESIAPAGNSESEPAFTDSKISLSFPQSVGDLSFVEHHSYPKAGLGYSIRYEVEDVMKVDIYVYDMGRSDISEGHTGDDIIQELGNAEAAIRYYEQKGAYRDVEKLGDGVYPPSVAEGDVAFQSTRYQYSQTARPGVAFTGFRISETFITGFKGHFIKVRVTYPKESASDSIKVRDRFLQRLAELIAAA